MTDKHNQRRQEEQEDAVLGLLMNEYVELEGEVLWREFQAAQAAGKKPKALKKEDRKLSRRSREDNRQKVFLKRFGNGLKRAAAIFLILICFLPPLAMSVEAFKIPVLNYIVALGKNFSGFNFGNNEYLTQTQEEVINLIQSEPCPDRYIISDQGMTSNGKMWIHFSCEGKIVMKIMIYPPTGQINIDMEDVDQIPMQIHDYEAVYLQKEGHRLMWIDVERELIFDLRAFELDKEDFWRYAYILIEKLSQ